MFFMNYDNKFGLMSLVKFHRYTGISYKFYNFNQSLSLLNKISIVSINLFIISITCFFIYQINIDEIWSASLQYSRSSFIIFILFLADYFLFAFCILYLIIIFVWQGDKIIKFLYEHKFVIDENFEKKLGTKIIIVQIVLPLIFQTTDLIVVIISSGVENFHEKFESFFVYLILTNVKITFLSLIAYYILCIKQTILNLVKNFNSLDQLVYISRRLFMIHQSVKQFDKYINSFMFIMLFHCSLGATSNIVVFYFNFGHKNSAALPSTIYNLVILFLVCYLSDISSFYNLIIEKLEELEETSRNTKQINYAIFNKLNFTF